MQLGCDEIILRALEPADVNVLYNWENDVAWWGVSQTNIPFSKHMLEQYVENVHDVYTDKQLRLMIQHSDGNTIGCVDLFDFDARNGRAGLGILIGDRDYQQNGHASSALKAVIEYGFEVLQLHQLYANVLANNAASIKLFKSTGFQEVGTRPDWVRNGEDWVGEISLHLINPNG